MSPETARALGYAEGKAAERLSLIRSGAERGLEVLLTPERPPMFTQRCRLCGEACRGVYCSEHEWAYGEAMA